MRIKNYYKIIFQRKALYKKLMYKNIYEYSVFIRLRVMLNVTLFDLLKIIFPLVYISSFYNYRNAMHIQPKDSVIYDICMVDHYLIMLNYDYYVYKLKLITKKYNNNWENVLTIEYLYSFIDTLKSSLGRMRSVRQFYFRNYKLFNNLNFEQRYLLECYMKIDLGQDEFNLHNHMCIEQIVHEGTIAHKHYVFKQLFKKSNVLLPDVVNMSPVEFLAN